MSDINIIFVLNLFHRHSLMNLFLCNVNTRVLAILKVELFVSWDTTVVTKRRLYLRKGRKGPEKKKWNKDV